MVNNLWKNDLEKEIMKKLNITKRQFKESKYFNDKYGTLEYVSESGRIYKTSKGRILMFKESMRPTMDDGFEQSGEWVKNHKIPDPGKQVYKMTFYSFNPQRPIGSEQMEFDSYVDCDKWIEENTPSGQFCGTVQYLLDSGDWSDPLLPVERYL